jgi:acyl dehydratase
VKYFEDYIPGVVTTLESVEVTEKQILEFAFRYDPQPFHIAVQEAAAGPFGSLIASGWHTCALANHALVTGYLAPESNLPSPGIDDLRWHTPVRPGDTLTWKATVLEARPSKSKPDRGIVRSLLEGFNQHSQIVLSLIAINMIRRAPLPASK